MEDKLGPELKENLKRLTLMFDSSVDLYTKPLTAAGVDCCLAMFEGLSSLDQMFPVLMTKLGDAPNTGPALFEYIRRCTDLPVESTAAENFDQLRSFLTAGMAVLLIDGSCQALAFSTQSMQFRSVQEPSGEGNIRGSREGFSEILRINISLVRRLVRAETLTVKTMQIGERTKTEAAIFYDRGQADPEFIKAIEKRLKEIRIPVLFDTGYLAPFFHKGGFSFFEAVGYTERPVTAAAKLCEGKAVVMVNGSPFAMVLPWFFSENFQSLDDYSSKAYFASFIRSLKYAAFFLAVLLPGVFVSVAGFTPELLPPQLLRRVAAAELATPLPLFLEMVLVIVLLEIIREAGLRLPRPIGHTVGLVAALIVGDTAVKTGILSTPVVIVAALTTIAVQVIPPLYEPSTVLRILFVLAGGLFGPLGITALFFVMILSICGMDPFGLPYTSPLIPFGTGAVRDGVFRLPWVRLAERPFNVNQLPGGKEHYEDPKH